MRSEWWLTPLLCVGAVGALIMVGYLSDPEGSKKKAHKQPKSRESTADMVLTGEEKPSATQVQPPATLQEVLAQAEKCKQKKEYDKAKIQYNRALRILQSTRGIGSNHLYYGLTTYALALVFKQNREFPEALKLMLRALAVIEAHKQANPSENELNPLEQHADVLATISDTYIAMKRYDEAEEYLDRAMEVIAKKAVLVDQLQGTPSELKQMQDKVNQEMAILVDNRSNLKWKQKNLQEAEISGKQALQMLADAFGKKESVYILCHQRLGQIYMEQGKRQEGRSTFENLLKEQEELLGSTSPRWMVLINWVASYCFACKEYDLSETKYRQLLELITLQPDTKENRITYNEVLNDLIVLYRSQEAKEQESSAAMEQLKSRLRLENLSPPLTQSALLTSLSSAIQVDAESAAPYYRVAVKVKLGKLPETAVLEFRFENPEGGEMILDHNVGSSEQITVASKHLSSITKDYYLVQVNVFSDPAKTQLVARHHQFCHSLVEYSQKK